MHRAAGGQKPLRSFSPCGRVFTPQLLRKTHHFLPTPWVFLSDRGQAIPLPRRPIPVILSAPSGFGRYL